MSVVNYLEIKRLYLAVISYKNKNGEERKRETERDIWPGWILFKNDNGAYGAYTEKSAGGN